MICSQLNRYVVIKLVYIKVKTKITERSLIMDNTTNTNINTTLNSNQNTDPDSTLGAAPMTTQNSITPEELAAQNVSTNQPQNSPLFYDPVEHIAPAYTTEDISNNLDQVEELDPIYATQQEYTANSAAPQDYIPYVSNESATVPQNSSPISTKKSKNRRPLLRFTALFVVFVFLGGIVFGAGYGTALYLGDQITPELVSRTQSLTFDVNRIEPIVSSTITQDSSKSIVSAIAKVTGPSVVTISSTIEVNQRSFFSNGITEAEGTGSGILYQLRDDDLLIVTNHHVIADAKKVVVTFHEGESFDANIIGYDSRMDLAVLSIPLSSLNESQLKDITIAKFGDSDKLEVGELAVAIGNPLGKEFSSTVTAGVISAVNREIVIDGTQLNLLQTDAAINPGNSGGALVDSLGEVIGINTAKYADVSIEGMGFAIPSSIAVPIIEKIIVSSTGSDIAYTLDTERPFLGVKISNITEDLYAQTGMPFGVYVTEVVKGSAADLAGILAGDVIYSVDGVKIIDTQALFDSLAKKSVDDTVKISVARGDQVITVEAKLTKYSDVTIN